MHTGGLCFYGPDDETRGGVVGGGGGGSGAGFLAQQQIGHMEANVGAAHASLMTKGYLPQ